MSQTKDNDPSYSFNKKQIIEPIIHGKNCNCTFSEVKKYSECPDSVQSKAENPNHPHDVTCPDCGSHMKSRKSVRGIFWGCIRYPNCKGTRDSNGLSKAERHAEEIKDEPR